MQQLSNSQTQQSNVPKNEWQLLDEIGRKLTRTLSLNSQLYHQHEKIDDLLIQSKNLINQLKSLMIKNGKKER
jgi:nitrate/nitrite-specific signal transduction histidine kinase